MDLEFTLVLVKQPGFQIGPYEIAYTSMGYHIIARFQYVGTQSQHTAPSSDKVLVAVTSMTMLAVNFCNSPNRLKCQITKETRSMGGGGAEVPTSWISLDRGDQLESQRFHDWPQIRKLMRMQFMPETSTKS